MISKEKYTLITNDVETTSILNHCLSNETGALVFKQGMPRLLELYSKYDIKATFFYTGHIAKLYPGVVKMVQKYGHEIGSHGLSHQVDNSFDLLSLKNQISNLKTSKNILEDICGHEIISFRAPAARVQKNTATALIQSGFYIDSSISSQRLDMFMSFGSLKKLHWLKTPRLPYFVNKENIFKKGHSRLLELPITAFGTPYIGTFMRIFPRINRLIRNFLHFETKLNGRPFVFLTHPNEFIDEESKNKKTSRRVSNYFSYLIGDLLRHKIKIKNLGIAALPILDEELKFFTKKGYRFVTCKEYYSLKKNEVSKDVL